MHQSLILNILLDNTTVVLDIKLTPTGVDESGKKESFPSWSWSHFYSCFPLERDWASFGRDWASFEFQLGWFCYADQATQVSITHTIVVL